jgi:hypothetical protein
MFRLPNCSLLAAVATLLAQMAAHSAPALSQEATKATSYEGRAAFADIARISAPSAMNPALTGTVSAISQVYDKPPSLGMRVSINQELESKDISRFLTRLKDLRLQNLLESATWTLTHDYSEIKRVDEVLEYVQSFFEALSEYEKGSASLLSRLGGFKGFKDKFAQWLNDDNQAIRAFAAVMLGISGDHAYASKLADLLKPRSYTRDGVIQYDRGRAAMALGLVGATEYAPRLAALLNSLHEYDRAGAAYGLGLLGAKDQANAIAKLLDDQYEGVREAAKESLEMLGASDLIKDKKTKKAK